jgi:hypothetical protein
VDRAILKKKKLYCPDLYHLRKANVIVDNFSRMPMSSLAQLAEMKRPVLKELQELAVNRM